jgi:hypothetical protein
MPERIVIVTYGLRRYLGTQRPYDQREDAFAKTLAHRREGLAPRGSLNGEPASDVPAE